MNRSSSSLLAALVLLVALGACSGVDGEPKVAAGPPPVPDAPAVWVMSELDACKLLSPDVLDGLTGAGTPYAASPHSCAVSYTAPDKSTDRLVVQVGTAFGTAGRAAAATTTAGGVRAYLTRDVPAGVRDDARCTADIPLSPSRSIRVDSASQGGDDLATSCAATTTVAEPLAGKLGAPGELAKAAETGDYGRWNACDLLESALGGDAPAWTADRSADGSPSADECRATPKDQAGAATSVQIAVAAGPATLPAPALGQKAVTLPAGPAVELATPSQCRLTYIGQPLSDGPATAAAQVVTLTERTPDGDPCTAAAGHAASITNTVTAPVPDTPQTPDRLGYAEGMSDDPTPPACGVPDLAAPGSCRAAATVAVPAGAGSVLQAALDPETGADVSCAVLGKATTSIAGGVELAAVDGTGCIALTVGGYAVTLGFADLATASVCTGTTESVVVAGRPGSRCSSSPQAFDLVVPALSSDPAGTGVLRVEGHLLPPRGDHVRGTPKDDDGRLHDLTTQIAKAVVTGVLQSA